MVEPLEAAAACFADDLLLLDFTSTTTAAVDGLTGLMTERGEEEEELEWLSNKDAFPALETSFERGAAASTSVLAAALPLLVPVRGRSKGRRRRRRLLPVFPPAGRRWRCRHCGAEETPQWRAGPEGPKTLCNACGVRYKSGRLVPEYRPAGSPTFSALLHSNSHRRILEMRRGRGDRGRRSTRTPPLVAL